MKRFLLIGSLLLGMTAVSYAQTDDIYATGADQRGGQSADSNHHRNYDHSYSGGGDNAPDNYQSYNSGDDYVDYDDDSYSSRINRFEYPFYNMGYYSVFYNPFWYNPYWVDPYGGYNPWYPGFGFSFGGPYWTSYWGWNSWYGYPGFYSCWHYPFYAGGWYGHYYGGYWNRVYGGIEGGRGRGYRYASYAPRQASMGNRIGNRVAGTGYRNGVANQVGLRSAPLAMASHTGNVRSAGGSGYGGNRVSQRGAPQGNRSYGQGQRMNGQQGARGNGGGRNFFGNGGGNRAFSGGRGPGNGFMGGGNRGAGGAARSFGGGGGMRSSGGGGGRSGGGGGRSGGGGHSGGGGRR